MSDIKIEALRTAVELSPDNHALRLVFAHALAEGSLLQEACSEYMLLFDADAIPKGELVSAGNTALAADRIDLLGKIIARARHLGVVEGISELQQERNTALLSEGVMRLVPVRGPELDVSYEKESALPPRFPAPPLL